MNDLLTLQALCTLLMCDDPSNLTSDARERIEKYADKESREMGFDNWIDAYHWTPDSEANAERIHGGAGDGKPSETPAPLDDASCSALPIARVIPHPWKQGETRNVYEFPVLRKIIIVADPIVPAAEILAMAKRCHDEEIGLKIMGGGYQMSLSLPNDKIQP